LSKTVVLSDLAELTSHIVTRQQCGGDRKHSVHAIATCTIVEQSMAVSVDVIHCQIPCRSMCCQRAKGAVATKNLYRSAKTDGIGRQPMKSDSKYGLTVARRIDVCMCGLLPTPMQLRRSKHESLRSSHGDEVKIAWFTVTPLLATTV